MTDIFLGRVTCSQRFASPYVLLSTRFDNPCLTLTRTEIITYQGLKLAPLISYLVNLPIIQRNAIILFVINLRKSLDYILAKHYFKEFPLLVLCSLFLMNDFFDFLLLCAGPNKENRQR